MFERLAKKMDEITFHMKLGRKQREVRSTLEKLKLEITREEELALIISRVSDEYEAKGNYDSEVHKLVNQRGPGEWQRIADLVVSAEVKIKGAAAKQ